MWTCYVPKRKDPHRYFPVPRQWCDWTEQISLGTFTFACTINPSFPHPARTNGNIIDKSLLMVQFSACHHSLETIFCSISQKHILQLKSYITAIGKTFPFRTIAFLTGSCHITSGFHFFGFRENLLTEQGNFPCVQLSQPGQPVPSIYVLPSDRMGQLYPPDTGSLLFRLLRLNGLRCLSSLPPHGRRVPSSITSHNPLKSTDVSKEHVSFLCFLPTLLWFPGVLLDPEDGADLFPRNVGWLSRDYAVLYPGIYDFP
jgi:hypothetical protein